jgi:hypothetical protein
MHRLNLTTSKIAIAELQIFVQDFKEQPQAEEDDDLFNDDAFNEPSKSKTHASWTCVAASPIVSNQSMQSPTMLTPPLKKGLTPKGACANHSLK